MGTVLRLRRLLERYRGVGYDEDALWLLGRAYVAVSMPDRARGVWSELVDKYPKSSHAGDARSALGGLRPGTGAGSAPVPGGGSGPGAAPSAPPAAPAPASPSATAPTAPSPTPAQPK
jgi:hypothetical protein